MCNPYNSTQGATPLPAGISGSPLLQRDSQNKIPALQNRQPTSAPANPRAPLLGQKTPIIPPSPQTGVSPTGLSYGELPGATRRRMSGNDHILINGGR